MYMWKLLETSGSRWGLTRCTCGNC